MRAEPQWGLQNVKNQANEVLAPAEYFNILASCSSSFDIWEVKYYHELDDHRALVDRVEGARLRPYLDYLGEERVTHFEKELEYFRLILRDLIFDQKLILKSFVTGYRGRNFYRHRRR